MPSNSPVTILARRLYDGSGGAVQRDVIVEVADGVIARAAPWQRGAGTGFAEHAIVSPGLIDMQINGAGDVQFNDDTTPKAVARMAEAAAVGGTAWIMPTFITAPGTAYLAAVEATRRAIQGGVPGILGVHLEGPFISPARPGIHERAAIRAMDGADLAALTGADFPGVLLVTLAPEAQPAGAVAELARAGVIVFAGHSEATAEAIAVARKDGLSGVTHLFNAMSQMGGRAPGVVGATLSGGLYAGIIADGQHVDFANIAIAARMMPDRLCLVTDAMCTLAGTRTEFHLHGECIRLSGGRLQNADGTLAGAHVAMDESIRNVIGHGVGSPEQAVRMATANPAAALGLADRLGRVAAGFASGLTLFDEDWRTCGVVRGHLAR